MLSTFSCCIVDSLHEDGLKILCVTTLAMELWYLLDWECFVCFVAVVDCSCVHGSMICTLW